MAISLSTAYMNLLYADILHKILTLFFLQVNVYKGVAYENICTKPENLARRESVRSLCPISEVQFVRAQEPTSVIQQRVRALLDGVIVVGFAFHNDLSVLGVTLSPDIVRDVKKSYTPESCAELGLCGLPHPAAWPSVQTERLGVQFKWSGHPRGSKKILISGVRYLNSPHQLHHYLYFIFSCSFLFHIGYTCYRHTFLNTGL